jgi:hypothetical protein
MKSHKYLALLIVPLAFCLFGCKKLVEVDVPKTQLTTSSVFNDDATAIAAIRGIYSKILENRGVYTLGAVYTGLSADELYNAQDANMTELYENELTRKNAIVQSFWSECYQYIYYANSILEGLGNSTGVTDAVKTQLEGEVKFVRAFSYFYLVNLWGDVPLILTTNYRINAMAPRTPKIQVNQQIISDLTDAQKLLKDDYSVSNDERIRPNKWAATALLARVYLYNNDWSGAEAHASAVLNQTSIYSLNPDLNEVFKMNSTEAIWQLKPVNPSLNSDLGQILIISIGLTISALEPTFLNGFEAGDNRKVSWIKSFETPEDTLYYTYKYKVRRSSTLTEYNMILRLAELYLIRAEARAQQGNIVGAQEDLNVIRNRAGLGNTTASTSATLLLAIEQERKVELFVEEGNHRWLDLKRTNRADAVLGVSKPAWEPNDALYPIPETEVLNNPNLTQNTGY